MSEPVGITIGQAHHEHTLRNIQDSSGWFAMVNHYGDAAPLVHVCRVWSEHDAYRWMRRVK